MTKSYTQWTLAMLRGNINVNDLPGFIVRDGKPIPHVVCEVEKYNEWAGGKNDLFGFIDIIALDVVGHKIIGVQSTGPNGHAEHRRNILASPRAIDWLCAGGLIWLVSWRKLLVKRGGKLRTWKPRVERFTLVDSRYLSFLE